VFAEHGSRFAMPKNPGTGQATGCQVHRRTFGRGMCDRTEHGVTVADAEGEEMDQGSMMRYLSELMLFSSAFLEDNISFQAIDTTSARVTLTDQARRPPQPCSSIPQAGSPNSWRAGKSRDLQTRSVPVTGYGEFEGLKLPVRVKAVWKLAEGDREDIDIILTELHHDA
jgi:hypothetical protein